jgi:tetratricopeptide (TPR) repeat protein
MGLNLSAVRKSIPGTGFRLAALQSLMSDIWSSVVSETTFLSERDNILPAAPKEKRMKRNLSLWLGLLAFAVVPALAQTPANPPIKGPSGKIHGHVTTPLGLAQTNGTVNLASSDDPKRAPAYIFAVNSGGDYAGEAPIGTYYVFFRAQDTPAGKEVDSFDNVKIVAAQDTLQDFDMSRKAFIDALPAETRKSIEDLKKQNAEIIKSNATIKNIQADMTVVSQDLKDIDGAHTAAAQALGAGAAKSDIDAKEAEIKTAKYTEIETLMLKDTAAKPEASGLWAQLGQAQSGLAKLKGDQAMYDSAAASFKKAIDLELAAKKPVPVNQSIAYAGLGEVYARTGKVAEAYAAFDSAAKVNPPGAWNNLKNEAVIFMQVGNGEAQAAAADEAIKADPNQAITYYIKGQGLIQKATIDSATGKMILPPGCADAYQKYLDLAPTGPYAAEVKGILAEATQTHSTSVGVQKSRKGK